MATTNTHWTPRDRRRWAARIDWLNRRHPLPKPVRIVWWPYKRDYGRVWEENGNYVIRIASRLNYSQAIYTLLEEWAHALTLHDAEAHSDAWGLMYARLIRASERYERKRRKDQR